MINQSMKKKLLLYGIIFWVIILIILVLILVNAIMNGGDAMFGEAFVVKQKSIECTGVNDLEVESDYGGIVMVSTTAPDITVVQYGGNNLQEKELFELSVNGDKIKIDCKHIFRLINLDFNFNERLVVEVPESWTGNVKVKNTSGRITLEDAFSWKDVKVSNNSGGIQISNGMAAENLLLDVISGGIHAEGVVTISNRINMKSKSGGIRAEEVKGAEKLGIESTSGGIKLGKMEVSVFDLKCSSGGINAEYLTGGGKIKTTSGGITVKLGRLSKDVEMRASSGGVKAYVEDGEAFTFSGKCSSGRIKANFPMKINDNKNKATAEVGESPSVLIQVQTTSGGIRMHQD